MAFRVKKGCTKRVFGEMVSPLAQADDGDFMQCEWRDGMRREVVHMTIGKWKKTQAAPAAKRDKPAGTSAEQTTEEELPDKFKGTLKDGTTKVSVLLKWNRQKKCRHQHLVTVEVGGKQLVQIDSIYFKAMGDGITWANNIAKKRITDDTMDKDKARDLKTAHQEANQELYDARVKDPAWNNMLEAADEEPKAEMPNEPNQPNEAETPSEPKAKMPNKLKEAETPSEPKAEMPNIPKAETPSEPIAGTQDEKEANRPTEVSSPTPKKANDAMDTDHETYSQPDKIDAMIGGAATATQTPRTRVSRKTDPTTMPTAAPASESSATDLPTPDPKRARTLRRIEPPPAKGDFHSDSQ